MELEVSPAQEDKAVEEEIGSGRDGSLTTEEVLLQEKSHREM